MKIWLTRHGQTDFNKAHLMQGRINEPLNDTGRAQAEAMRRMLLDANPSLTFDAVYSSPLDRAMDTASIIGGVDKDQIIVDERIIEAGFGKYEGKKYHLMGPHMTLFWALPEVFPAPRTVETIPSMVRRSRDFLRELEQKDYDNVLVTCHGGIARSLSGYLSDAPRGYIWRPKPVNCEVRVFESTNGEHRFITGYKLD